MSNNYTSKEMVSKHKNKVLTCSTPEHRGDSPSRDSDSICDSEAASPVPFLCTQDGAEGETDVVWNFYTPTSKNAATSRVKNSTPLSRRSKRTLRPKAIEKPIPKRRPVKPSQKKTELFQELLELNQNLHELMAKKQNSSIPEKPQSGSEDEIFNESLDCSPKCIPRSSSRCLRKNVLSSNFGRPDPETALESDDSMNECLLKASQIVEEKILKHDPVPTKKMKYDNHNPSKLRTDINIKMDQDSMDAILNSIRLESPVVSKVKKCESPCMSNDTFDNIVGNLNDSALEQLTQMPIKTDPSRSRPANAVDWTLKDFSVHESSPSSKSFFGRHNSMPESPSVQDLNKPSTSGMVFGRYSSMPYNNEGDTVPGDSPIRCTPDEIKKKHQQAREKLMAKRLLPFTMSQQTQPTSTQSTQPKKSLFQPKVPSSNNVKQINVPVSNVKQIHVPVNNVKQNNNSVNNIKQINNPVHNANSKQNNSTDLKQLIEKKRQEALMKLRRRQPYK